jgi:hypothetical protein
MYTEVQHVRNSKLPVQRLWTGLDFCRTVDKNGLLPLDYRRGWTFAGLWGFAVGLQTGLDFCGTMGFCRWTIDGVGLLRDYGVLPLDYRRGWTFAGRASIRTKKLNVLPLSQHDRRMSSNLKRYK